MRRSTAAALTLALLVGVACHDSDERGRPRASVPATSAPAAPATTTPCTPDPALAAPGAPVPPDLAAAVQRFATDPAVIANQFGLSIWVDGLGEVGAYQPDLPLFPASNQKLLTAMGVLAVLGADTRFTTAVQSAPDGSLVITAGGDPSLTARGPHSLDALAAQVRAVGITTVPGPLVVDESRHDALRRAAGWQDWQFPTYAGPLSALMVDRNRYRRDPTFLADPAIGNGELLREVLGAHVGARVGAPHRHAPAQRQHGGRGVAEGDRPGDRPHRLDGRRPRGHPRRAGALVRPDRGRRRRRLGSEPGGRPLRPRVAHAPAGGPRAAVVAAPEQRAARRRAEWHAHLPLPRHAGRGQRPCKDRDDHRRHRAVGIRDDRGWARLRLLRPRERKSLANGPGAGGRADRRRRRACGLRL